jgi:hypothetical protein
MSRREGAPRAVPRLGARDTERLRSDVNNVVRAVVEGSLARAHAAARDARSRGQQPQDATLRLEDGVDVRVMWNAYVDSGSVRVDPGAFSRARYGSLLPPGTPNLRKETFAMYCVNVPL